MALANWSKPTERVRHADQTLADEDTAYRWRCPWCARGVFLVQRGPDMRLRRFDRCISCGQSVIYTDESINGEPFAPLGAEDDPVR